jgi:hypothetical protein
VLEDKTAVIYGGGGAPELPVTGEVAISSGY